MAPLIYGGATVPAAFRIINVLSYCVFLEGTRRLTRHLTVGPVWRAGVLAMTALHALPETLFFTHADVLGGAVFTWALLAFIPVARRPRYLLAGILGGLAFYAKNVLLLVFTLGALILAVAPRARTSRRGALTTAIAAWIVALPWITILSIEYHRPVISGQQLIVGASLPRHEYHPDVPVDTLISDLRPDAQRPSSGAGFVSDTATNFVRRVIRQLDIGWTVLVHNMTRDYLTRGAFEIYVLLALIGALTALSTRAGAGMYALSVFAAGLIGTYMVIWGGNPRYYVPVLPIVHLWFVIGCSNVSRITLARFFSYRRSYAALLLRACLGFMVAASVWVTAETVYMLWTSARPETVSYLLSRPELRERKGQLSSKLLDIHSPQAGYLLGREQWSVINPDLPWTAARLQRWLCRRKIEQVLWLGDKFQQIEEIEKIVIQPLGRASDTTATLYTIPCGEDVFNHGASE